MGGIQASRLREAREFLGFARDQVAQRLGWSVETLAALEEGGTIITGEQLRKLTRLYRYPVAWFSGETRFEPGLAVLHMVEEMHPDDRATVLAFAEWLSFAGPAPKITRADLAGDDGGPDAS